MLAHVLELPEPYPELPQVAPGVERMVELEEEQRRWWLASLGAGGTPDCDGRDRGARGGEGARRAAGPRRRALSRPPGGRDARRRRVQAGAARQGPQQLLGHAPCPVLLVPGGVALEGRRTVVAGLDGSPPSRAVIAVAEAVAASLFASLLLLHVVDAHVGMASLDAVHDLRVWAREQGRRIVDEARDLVTAPLEIVLRDVREGRPSDELAAACEERGATLAVVGSRGLHGFAGLLLGSTARRLVDAAPCSVLVVPTTEARRADRPAS